MKIPYFILRLVLGIIFFSLSISAQKSQKAPPPPPPPPPARLPAPTPPRLSEVFAKNLEQLPPNFESSRENRQQAYAKLLEGQRYIWSLKRFRKRLNILSGARLAKESLRQAIEFDPNLAEAYTALAELSLSVPPQDLEEAVKLSKIATKLDKNNLGGHRLLARLYTIKSNVGRGKVNVKSADQAIYEWLEVTRLDPRDAEGWAFLSDFYKEKNEATNQIIALRNWFASSTPLDVEFYASVMIRDGDLSQETASIKLGAALLENGKDDEALSVLTRAVSDTPANLDAIELLGRALENAEGKSLSIVNEALRQAVYANPESVTLNLLLAQTIAKSGNIEEAVTFLKVGVKRFLIKDIDTAASLQVSLGDIYSESKRYDLAIENYKEALKLRGISSSELTNDDEREFAFLVVNKMINTYKDANRFEDAKKVVSSYRLIFGKDDNTLEREFINVLIDSGKKSDALQAVRTIRAKSPYDYGLIRTEASLLTDLGKVDEGVAMIRNLIDRKPEDIVRSIMYDDFENYIFISSLYLQARRNDDAIDTAHKAVDEAGSKERKEIAKLTLASATQSAGNFEAAEDILNKILEETPENPIALNNLGYLFLESGKNFEVALKLINKALQIDPRNPSYLDSLGWAYYKLGKFSEAEKFLNKAISIDSSSPTLFEHLGDIYNKLGKTSEAKNAWKQALTLTSNSVDSKRIEAKLVK